MTSSVFLEKRTLLSSSIRYPTRVVLPSDVNSDKLEISIGASFSVIPPCGFCAFGLLCFLTKFTPSTMALFVSRDTLNTLPSVPLCEPAITLTLSHFFILIFVAISKFYNTSGANETIFINCLSLNSLATGPNTRVPRISPVGLSNTQAFSSKRM